MIQYDNSLAGECVHFIQSYHSYAIIVRSKEETFIGLITSSKMEKKVECNE